MADSIELRMSVTSIKRVDPYAKDILATATHVALYIFNTSTNEWEKTDTEGALFIYSRNGEPFHSIMVMNRLNTDNLIEPIVKDFDYQMQVPFLLYRNSKSKIFGIWFFNREECIRITFLIESLMEGLKDKVDEKSKRREKCVDIFSMLSKAQEDFNKTPTKQDGPPTFSSTPRVPDVTSQSVMDFFAKASTKTSQKPSVSGGNGENVLQRLMSNPAHSVEHIEKQQRSVTPQEIGVVQRASINADRRSVPIAVIQKESIFPDRSVPVGIIQKSKSNIPDRSPAAVEQRDSILADRSGPISFAGPSTGERKVHPENGFNFNVSSVNQQQSPLAFLLQGPTQSQMEKEESTELLGSSPFAKFAENCQKPQLMTPMMFTTASAKEKPDNAACEIDLLTEKQLAQALIHLLKNNSDFTKQIHEAYVQSIMERVNLNNSKSLI